MDPVTDRTRKLSPILTKFPRVENASHEAFVSLSSPALCPSREEQLFNKLSFLSGTPDKLTRGRTLADT